MSCIVDRIPAARRFDVPDLIASLIAAAEPIAAYQSSDYWMDVGCPDDFAIAQRDFAAAPERFLNAHRPPAAETA
jgi:NDP-sugar pyrophosphorylase family protein